VFKDGQTNVHDQERTGQPSVVSDDLVPSERQRSTISEDCLDLPYLGTWPPLFKRPHPAIAHF
jgi:hypothetical protein